MNGIDKNRTEGYIIELSEHQVNEAAQFAWQTYFFETKRTTPPYHSLSMMQKQFHKKVKSKYERLLGYYENQKLIGVFSIDVNDEEKYICTTGGPYIMDDGRYDEIATAFMDYLEVACKGYVCYFGTTKPNIASQKFLEAKGFICTEDTVQTRIDSSHLKEIALNYEIQTLTEDDFDAYRHFHQIHFKDYYWTADKIYGVFEKWLVHIVKDHDVIVGSIFTMRQTEKSGEVYGVVVLPKFEATTLLEELIYINTATWLSKGVTEIVNFIPEGRMLDAALKVGYEAYDTYLCYFKESI